MEDTDFSSGLGFLPGFEVCAPLWLEIFGQHLVSEKAGVMGVLSGVGSVVCVLLRSCCLPTVLLVRACHITIEESSSGPVCAIDSGLVARVLFKCDIRPF